MGAGPLARLFFGGLEWDAGNTASGGARVISKIVLLSTLGWIQLILPGMPVLASEKSECLEACQKRFAQCQQDAVKDAAKTGRILSPFERLNLCKPVYEPCEKNCEVRH